MRVAGDRVGIDVREQLVEIVDQSALASDGVGVGLPHEVLDGDLAHVLDEPGAIGIEARPDRLLVGLEIAVEDRRIARVEPAVDDDVGVDLRRDRHGRLAVLDLGTLEVAYLC